MEKYELYAFEFHVQQLKTSKVLEDVQLEVKLFQGPPVILKTSRSYCQEQLLSVKKLICSDNSLDEARDKDENSGPFALDMESVNADLKEKESYEEEDSSAMSEFNEIITKPPVKRLRAEEKESSDATGQGITTSDSTNAKGEAIADVEVTQTADRLKRKTSGSSKVDHGNVKKSLRLFPKDPTGQPYHKVKKSGANLEESARTNDLKNVNTQEDDHLAKTSPVSSSKNDKPPAQSEPNSEEPKEEKDDTIYENENVEIDSVHDDHPAEMNNLEIHSDTLEAGVTMVVGMPGFRMLHKLQRYPLEVRVVSTSCALAACGLLDLCPLSEAVLRAERGPPTPVLSSVSVLLTACGDFTADLYCSLRLFAFGTRALTQIITPGDPNEKMNHERKEEAPQFQEYNMDIHNTPPLITCAEQISLRYSMDRRDKERVEEYPQEKGAERFFVEEDIVYSPNNRKITPRPSDNYEIMKWKIDRILGLATVREEEHEQAEDQRRQKEKQECEERAQKLDNWCKEKKKNLNSRVNELNKNRRETRTILRKILQGMNEPDPICPPREEAPGEEETENENENKRKYDDNMNDPKRLYEEIHRQQREEKIIKHYKRLFRKMLRSLETERGVWPGELKRREKKRKTMKDLLAELETFGSDDVERAYTEMMKFRKEGERKAWDLDTWPDIPEENEIEELDGGEEDELQISTDSI